MYNYLRFILLLIVILLYNNNGISQIVFSENFENSALDTNKIPFNWKESGLSKDGYFEVGDSLRANFLINGVSQWNVPNHTKFVMTSDIRCSYEIGGAKCNKSQDRLILPEFDFSTLSGTIVFSFDVFFTGKLGSTASIEVSVDKGSSWTKVYTITSDITKWTNQVVDLSSYISNKNVTISILYNDNNMLRDGLAIDNIILKKQKPWKDVSIVYASASKYAVIPETQFDSIPLDLTIYNNGSLQLDSVKLKVNIFDITLSKSLIYSKSVYCKNIQVKDTLRVSLGKFFPNGNFKKYLIQHTVLSKLDTIPTNDSLNVVIRTNSNEYARDYGKMTMLFDMTSANAITLGNVYNINKKVYLDSVLIGITKSNATLGSNIQVQIFPVVNGSPTLSSIGKSDVYTISTIDTVSNLFLKVKNSNFERLVLDTGSYLVALTKLNSGLSMGLNLCANYYQNNTVFINIGNSSFQTLDSYFSGTKKTVPKIRAFCSPYCTLSARAIVKPARCDSSYGSVIIRASNGDSPLTMQWDNKDVDTIVNKVEIGKHRLTIKDKFACSFDTNGIVMAYQSPPILKVDSIKHVSCYDSNDGYISLFIQDQVPLKSIFWNGVQTNTTFNQSLKSGNYLVKVFNQFSCSDSMLVSITKPDSLSVTYSVKDEIINKKGEIYLSVSGGTTPYTYDWGGNEYSKNRVDLNGDSVYSVSVKDFNNCLIKLSIPVAKLLILNNVYLNNLTVYPIPTKDFLFIANAVEGLDYLIIDDMGRQVESGEINSSISGINMLNLQEGTYQLKIFNSLYNVIFRIVKI